MSPTYKKVKTQHKVVFNCLGMVSICGGANVYEPWAALVIGTMAGIIFLAVRQLMFKLQVTPG